MTTAKEYCTRVQKKHAVEKLNEMGLNQIAQWLEILPEDRWEEMFAYCWPTLAGKCGIHE